MMEIAEYYNHKTLLITGCTGFVGKVVLEKIMRSCCPGVKRIYILMRPKKGVSLMKRVDEIFKYDLFEPYFN